MTYKSDLTCQNAILPDNGGTCYSCLSGNGGIVPYHHIMRYLAYEYVPTPETATL